MHIIESLNRLNRERQVLLKELQHEPSPHDLAERLKIPVAKVLLLLDSARVPASLDAPIAEGTESTVRDLAADPGALSPEEAIIAGDLAASVERAMEPLCDREREVLRLRFGLGVPREHTLEEIGRRLSLSRERVRQIQTRAIAKMKAAGRGRAA